MSFSNGNSQQPELNVTPLIDVLLVLIIIFMILVPQKPDGLKALVPQPPQHSATPPPPDPTTIVVEVHAHAGGLPSYSINQQAIEKEAIVAKLTEIFAPRSERTMFVKGDADLEFGAIAEVVSMGHKARADSIGVLTPKGQAEM